MNKKSIIAIVAVGIFFASTLISCHRNTCPTFNKVDDVNHVEVSC